MPPKWVSYSPGGWTWEIGLAAWWGPGEGLFQVTEAHFLLRRPVKEQESSLGLPQEGTNPIPEGSTLVT